MHTHVLLDLTYVEVKLGYVFSNSSMQQVAKNQDAGWEIVNDPIEQRRYQQQGLVLMRHRMASEDQWLTRHKTIALPHDMDMETVAAGLDLAYPDGWSINRVRYPSPVTGPA